MDDLVTGPWVAGGVHAAMLLAGPFALAGCIQKTKAWFAGRRGPPWLQLVWDVRRLASKGVVVSDVATPVFWAGPAAGFAAAALAGLVVPMGGQAPVGFVGDAVCVAYLFAFARFMTVAAALDTGSPFEGMGGAREVAFAVLAEPALFFVLLVLGRVTGSGELAAMLGPSVLAGGGAPVLLAASALFIVVLAENSRIPFDDPSTHLELTMVHEVMVLDHSGPPLALVQWGAAIKLWVMGALLAGLAAPSGAFGPMWDRVLFCAAMACVGVAVGVVESGMARLRMAHAPNLLVAAGALSGLGFALACG